MSLWLYLHYPSLQLDSAFVGQDQQAIIIVQGSKNEVVQLNPSALAQGVKVGMGLGTAAALCANLSVHSYEQDIEVAKLKEIAQWLYWLTSDISFFEPDGILLRISNMLCLYDGLDNYWKALQAHMQVLNLSYQYASAASPLAARLLARAGLNRIYAQPKQAFAAVQQQPLALTDLPAKTITTLSRVGIRTVAELLAIPMADIARRFDINLVNYVGRLTGQFKHPFEFYHPPQQFSCYLELLFDVENVQWLNKPLQKLLKQLESFLKLRDKLAHELLLVLHQRDGDKLEIPVSSAAGEYQSLKWLALLALRLESIVIGAPVTGISLKASRVAERLDIKADLFTGERGSQSPQELVSFLQAKLGQQAVCGIMLDEDPRPERANLLCAALSSHPVPLINPHRLRPSILLPAPKPLTIKVSIIQGPERILAGWWDNQAVHRDYFVAHSETGQRLWIFRDKQHRWFIHGLFC
jgi:protein ImuB